MLAVSRVGASWYAAVVGKVSSSELACNRAADCAVGKVLTIELVKFISFVILSFCKLLDTLASFGVLELSVVPFPFLSCRLCMEEVMISWKVPCS